MGRKVILEHVEIKTCEDTYTATIRQDPDTGLVTTGLCGEPVEAYNVNGALIDLQIIADKIDNICYHEVWVVDPGVEEPYIERYCIGFHRGNRALADCLSGYTQYMVVDGALAHVGPIPKRWIIKPATPEAAALLQRYIDELRATKQRVAESEKALESLTNDNTATWQLLLQSHAAAPNG